MSVSDPSPHLSQETLDMTQHPAGARRQPFDLEPFLAGLSDQQKTLFLLRYSLSHKDRTTALILSVLFGMLGVDRLYVGDYVIGAVKLLTLGACGIWWLIDLFLIQERVDDFNRTLAAKISLRILAGSPGKESETHP